MRLEQLSDRCLLILADNREVEYEELPAFDAVISDPPYGINHQKGSWGSGPPNARDRPTRRNTQKIVEDNVPFDPRWLLSLSANVALFGADHFAARLPETGRWLAWDKLAGKASWDHFSDVEFIWHSKKGRSEICTHLWKGIVCWKTGEEHGRRYHPTQKPIRVMTWLWERCGKPARVLDPYMGVGSTGVAVLRAGASFIGVEVVEEFFEVAVTRCRKELEKTGAPIYISGEPA